MSRVNIEGREYDISKIFSNDFVFSIPRYQRPYAWTTEHAGELLEDLLSFLGEGDIPVSEVNPYFLGSIVLIKGSNLPRAEVVDGQQRLTTLTILLAAIRSLVPHDAAEGLTAYLYEKGNVMTDTPNRYRLKLREKDATFFQKYIQDEGGIQGLSDLGGASLSDSQRNIRENALLFIRRLGELDGTLRVRLGKFIVQRCFLVVVSTPDLDSAYRIFSVLNDRGLDLSLTDILKAEIIGAISASDQDVYTRKWEDAEDGLGRDGFQELFAHIRTIYRKVKLRDTVLKEFRAYVKPQAAPKEFIDEVLQPYVTAFETIRDARYQSTQHPNTGAELLRWLNQIDNFDWVPVAMLFLRHHDEPDGRARFLASLERLAAGLMITRANVNQRIERYARILTAMEQGDDLYAPNSPLDLTPQERGDIVTALNGNIYGVQSVPRYVLLRLDSALAQGEATYNYPVVTIEHVLPQTPQPGSLWLQWFPDTELRDRYVHRLGNLVLLSRRKNSQAQNFDFEQKKDRYFKLDGISKFALTTQVLNEREWTPSVVDRRQDELLNKLKMLWKL